MDLATAEYQNFLEKQSILKVTNAEVPDMRPPILNYQETDAHKIKVLQNNVAALQAMVSIMGIIMPIETPIGLIDGINNVYLTANQYRAGSLIVWYNGSVLRPGIDYTESGPGQFTTTFIPQDTDNLYVGYKY